MALIPNGAPGIGALINAGRRSAFRLPARRRDPHYDNFMPLGGSAWQIRAGSNRPRQEMHRKSPPRRRKKHRVLILLLALAFFLPIAARATIFAFDDTAQNWWRADWSSVGALPAPRDHADARVLVLSARTGGWRGIFAVHSWVVLKPENGDSWTRYDVVGWGNPIRTNGWAPDGRWRGNNPTVVADVRGPEAQRLIPKIEAAVKDYQWRNTGDYRVWPGPNSNTFVATVLRAVPELDATLPANAIGRDFRPEFYFGRSDSGTGIELNLWGYAGVKVGWVEGIELNFLSLVTGLDLRGLAIKLPGFGNVGLDFFDWSASAGETSTLRPGYAN
jgi:hypothetical protein